VFALPDSRALPAIDGLVVLTRTTAPAMECAHARISNANARVMVDIGVRIARLQSGRSARTIVADEESALYQRNLLHHRVHSFANARLDMKAMIVLK